MKKILLQCSTQVNNKNIRRESVNGVEHIVVTSFTLPADIVMNGGLYPQDERDKSFITLERTLAPVEHPQDSNGNFISANDPLAIHNYHAGAFNQNVEIDAASNRVKIEKWVNVQEAMKTDRGKRLLDRIEEIETSDNPRPIHTSVGVFLLPEELEEPRVNATGQEYTWIARDMIFDHDSILLGSVGAATPSQGVGIGVNEDGQEFEVNQFLLDNETGNHEDQGPALAPNNQKWISSSAIARLREFTGANEKPNKEYAKNFMWVNQADSENFNSYKLPINDVVGGVIKIIPNALKDAVKKVNSIKAIPDDEKQNIIKTCNAYLTCGHFADDNRSMQNNKKSFSQIVSMMMEKLNENSSENQFIWLEEIWDNKVVFEKDQELFEVQYSFNESDQIVFDGVPTKVEKETTFKPVNNEKGDAMKEMLINALAAAGIKVNEEITDDELMAKYNEMMANQSSSDSSDDSDDTTDIAEVVANALKPVTDELASIKSTMTANQDAELEQFADVVVNSGKYEGFEKEDLIAMGIDKVKSLAANCQVSMGLPLSAPVINSGNDEWKGFEMPK